MENDLEMKHTGHVLSHSDGQYTFVSWENHGVGDFVCYRDEDSASLVLSRVAGTEPVSSFPHEFLSCRRSSPGEIASFMGIDTSGCYLLKVNARIVGSFVGHKSSGEFVRPNTYPTNGKPVYCAPDALLSDISKLGFHDIGSIEIGAVLNRNTNVAISARDVVSQHLSIIASTGAGKSYTVGVLIEEMMKPKNQASILVFDPHGEYSSLKELANMPDWREGQYKPRIKIVHPGSIRIRLKDLKFGEMMSIIDDGTTSDKMRVLFKDIYESAMADDRNGMGRFDHPTLRRTIEEKMAGSEQDASSYNGLLWRLNKLDNPIFSPTEHVPLGDYFQPGLLTILDLSGIDDVFQQLISSVLMRRLFDARKKTQTGKTVESHGPDKFLPFPVFTIFEEAHRFAPQNGEAKSKGILKTVLSEGRKFGIGVCLVSQRPSKLDADSLSQCMTQITMRIINPVDQSQVAASLESMDRDLLRELPGLAKGQAIISGIGVNTPVKVQVRHRATVHGGKDLDAPELWRRHMAEHGIGDEQVPSSASRRMRDEYLD